MEKRSTIGMLFACICLVMISAVQGDFKSDCLFAHNKARIEHINTPDLQWDVELANSATQYARILAGINERATGSSYDLRHSNGAGNAYGENIYGGTSGGFTGRKIAHAMYFWYREGIGYDYKNPSPWGSTGHFTQVIWRTTNAVGCGKVDYFKNMMIHTIIVCQYRPKGNISMRYIMNVMPLRNRGKDRFTVEELERGNASGCLHTDKNPQACHGMKSFCNDGRNSHLMRFLQDNCKKTCNC